LVQIEKNSSVLIELELPLSIFDHRIEPVFPKLVGYLVQKVLLAALHPVDFPKSEALLKQ